MRVKFLVFIREDSFFYNLIVHNFNQPSFYLTKFWQHFAMVFKWHKMKAITRNIQNQICTRITTRNVNQNYVKYMICQLKVIVLLKLFTWTIQDSIQLLSLQPPLLFKKCFKKNYNWRSSRQIHVLNLKW